MSKLLVKKFDKERYEFVVDYDGREVRFDPFVSNHMDEKDSGFRGIIECDVYWHNGGLLSCLLVSAGSDFIKHDVRS